MLKRIRRALVRKLFGNNFLLQRLLLQEFKKGKVVKASLLALYFLPLRKALKLDNPLVEQSFITSLDYYNAIQEFLHISRVEGFDLTRIGSKGNAGYVMLDDFNGEKIAYSFGIGDDVVWDKDMASRGYDVFMYDHTIDGLPEQNPRFHWSKLGIADGIAQDERLRTLDELLTQNHHENKHNMILKMDVEGAEWGFLRQTSSETLSRFSQVIFEFHAVNDLKDYELILEGLKKLNQTHKLVHLHANNWGYHLEIGGKNFPTTYEVSYVLKDKYNVVDDYDPDLPLDLDSQGSIYIPDCKLGHWNRRTEIDDRFTIYIRKM